MFQIVKTLCDNFVYDHVRTLLVRGSIDRHVEERLIAATGMTGNQIFEAVKKHPDYKKGREKLLQDLDKFMFTINRATKIIVALIAVPYSYCRQPITHRVLTVICASIKFQATGDVVYVSTSNTPEDSIVTLDLKMKIVDQLREWKLNPYSAMNGGQYMEWLMRLLTPEMIKKFWVIINESIKANRYKDVVLTDNGRKYKVLGPATYYPSIKGNFGNIEPTIKNMVSALGSRESPTWLAANTSVYGNSVDRSTGRFVSDLNFIDNCIRKLCKERDDGELPVVVLVEFKGDIRLMQTLRGRARFVIKSDTRVSCDDYLVRSDLRNDYDLRIVRRFDYPQKGSKEDPADYEATKRSTLKARVSEYNTVLFVSMINTPPKLLREYSVIEAFNPMEHGIGVYVNHFNISDEKGMSSMVWENVNKGQWCMMNPGLVEPYSKICKMSFSYAVPAMIKEEVRKTLGVELEDVEDVAKDDDADNFDGMDEIEIDEPAQEVAPIKIEVNKKETVWEKEKLSKKNDFIQEKPDEKKSKKSNTGEITATTPTVKKEGGDGVQSVKLTPLELDDFQ